MIPLIEQVPSRDLAAPLLLRDGLALFLHSLQVKSGTIFDNFLITDDEKFAEEFGSETWGATKVWELVSWHYPYLPGVSGQRLVGG